MLCALSVPGQAQAQTVTAAAAQPARPIKPEAGNIRTFAGGLNGTAGNIRTFQGQTTPDAGNIRTFAGNIRTFAGNIRTFQLQTYPVTGPDPLFWGALTPQAGTLAPSAGNIRTFSGNLDVLAGNIRTFNSSLPTIGSDPVTASKMMAQINALVSLSQATWGAAVQRRTGKSFADAFATPMLSKYGIDPSKPASLANLNEAIVELFLLDWNDNLMNYSGLDQTDHWMKEVNWNPSLTQQVIGGKGAKIGILDFTISTTTATSNISGIAAVSVKAASGISTEDNGHGTAVASLIVSPHDGQGIMGIAPTAKIVSYNPFDATMTAGWADIQTGLNVFVDANVSVVNMSLGVSGWTLNEGWNTVFTNDKLFKAAQGQLFVLAAGNDGVVQPADIEWKVARNPVIIVVGSVDSNGVISSFSNTPGTTCLLKNGKCKGADDLLMNRFIVAPGEFILVDDGQGGVTRMSGTSVAAPLVSGTASLIVDRWPWLGGKPNEIADIILNSATDLGAPGVDAVYGHGELNVTAALSPLDFSKLQWKVKANGAVTNYTSAAIATTAMTSKALWEAAGAYVTVFENTATSYRDFNIPLSSKLAGLTVGNSNQQFNAYLQSRFWAWAQAATASTTKPKAFTGFTDNGATTPFFNFGKFDASLTVRRRAYQAGLRQEPGALDSAWAFQTPDGRVRMDFGNGAGASTLAGMSGFGMQSDFDYQSGGANPFLGLASGSGYGSVTYRIGNQITASGGFTHRKAVRDRQTDLMTAPGVRAYEATAYTMRVGYRANDWLSTQIGYTMLDEKNALLGMQSADPSDLSGGTRTDAMTLGIEVTPDSHFALAASATVGRARHGDSTRQNLAAGSSGIMTTSFAVSLARNGLVTGRDSLRLAVSQPLHVERGSIEYTGVEVIDRQTGELGNVTRSFALQGQPRSHVVDSVYRLPLGNGNAAVSVFGKFRFGEVNKTAGESPVMAGMGFNVLF